MMVSVCYKLFFIISCSWVFISESYLLFESNEYTMKEDEEQNAKILIRGIHEGFSFTVTPIAKNNFLGDAMLATVQDVLEPLTYTVEASNQMFDVPLTDFVFDDLAVEYTQKFMLKACYKEMCNSTFVYIEDDDSECYSSAFKCTLFQHWFRDMGISKSLFCD